MCFAQVLLKSDNYKDYTFLYGKGNIVGYWSNPVTFKGALGNLWADVDANIDNFQVVIDVGEDLDSDGAVGGKLV